MATGGERKTDLKPFTDCQHFVDGDCKFAGKCNYRHCIAVKTEERRCRNWPSKCRNINCAFRHPNTSAKFTNCVGNQQKSAQRSTKTENTIQKLEPTAAQPLSTQEKIIAFFWDIENVQIPKGRRAFDIVQRIRQILVTLPGLKEESFTCFCNINNLPKEHQLGLHHSNVRIVHVPDPKSGATDRQIMLELDNFERLHRPPATIVLISGDIDFVGKLSDLRHKAGFNVIVLHNKPAKEELKKTVDMHYPWQVFTEGFVDDDDDDDDQNEKSRNTGDKVTEKKSFRCTICASQFDSITAVHQHQDSKGHKVKCDRCLQEFYVRGALNKHKSSCVREDNSGSGRMSTTPNRKHRRQNEPKEASASNATDPPPPYSPPITSPSPADMNVVGLVGQLVQLGVNSLLNRNDNRNR